VPKYLIQGSYTAEGLKGLAKDKASGRRASVTRMLERAGVKLEAFYYSFGADDFILIVDGPDNATATAISIAVSSTGLAQTRITPLLTIEEVDQALGTAVAYQGPGR
jgi:uncharacterized protein with GYD domain